MEDSPKKEKELNHNILPPDVPLAQINLTIFANIQ